MHTQCHVQLHDSPAEQLRGADRDQPFRSVTIRTSLAAGPRRSRTSLVLAMKRYIKFLPLLCLAPLAHFFGFYLAGLGIIDAGLGMFIGAIGLYPLILAVALVFGFVAPSSSNFVRYSSCLGAIVAQFALLPVLPGGAQAEVMGVAHRLKREFPIAQVRECANQLLEKYQARTLVSADKDSPQAELWSNSAFAVDSSELPASLRDRVRWVRITKVERGFTQDLQVFFFIDWGRSIICDSRPFVSDARLHSIEKGVHVYHAQRS